MRFRSALATSAESGPRDPCWYLWVTPFNSSMEDKVVLITGASSGIGAATAEHFADIGYKKLSLVARREEKLKDLAEKCKAKGAKDVLVLPLDLSDMECAKSAVVKTVEHFSSEYLVIDKFIGMDQFVLSSIFRKMNHSNELEWFILSSVHFYCGKNKLGTKCPNTTWFYFPIMNSKKTKPF